MSQAFTAVTDKSHLAVFQNISEPAYVIDEQALVSNLEVLERVKQAAGCQILLALKAFSSTCVFPLMSDYLDGFSASSLHELRLGLEHFNGNGHVYAPAYDPRHFDDIAQAARHIVFNSYAQWERYRHRVDLGRVKCGIRLNPLYSEVQNPLYNPCANDSRFGIQPSDILFDWEGLTGIHIHALCQQSAGVLERVWAHIERHFGHLFDRCEWLNLGGGHMITQEGYDIDSLIKFICRIQDRYNIQVILEPGECVVLNAGYLVAKVLDVAPASEPIAILNVSATAHMPDVLEMPYRPHIMGSFLPGDAPFTYQLGGHSCLSGDVMGRYSFFTPLAVGDTLVFTDMAAYTMVKNTQFNGLSLPSIYVLGCNGQLKLVQSFDYYHYQTSFI